MSMFPTITTSYIKEKWQHAGFQKYLKNTGWMFAGRIFSLIISFFVSVYMARSLGAEDYGTLNFIISFVTIAGTSFFVIDSILIKKLNYEPENTEEILGSALIIKLINSLLTIIIATTASVVFSNSNITTILVFAFSIFTIFQSINSSIDPYFQAHTKISFIIPINILTSILSAILKISLIFFKVNIIYLLLSYTFDHLISSLGYIYIYQRKVGNILNWKINLKTIKWLMFNSWPFTISALAIAIYTRVDQIFIKIILGSQAVGHYVVAVRFSEVWFFISSVICASLLPAILNAQKTSQKMFLSRSKKLYSLLFYLSIAICITIFLISPLIIKTLYGPEFLPSINLLRIYIWSIIGIFISTALQQILLAQNKLRTIFLLNIIGMILSLILNYLLIPTLGIKGAAIANIFAYTLPLVFILSLKHMKEQRISLMTAILKPLN